jgi:hypothetical protein
MALYHNILSFIEENYIEVSSGYIFHIVIINALKITMLYYLVTSVVNNLNMHYARIC